GFPSGVLRLLGVRNPGRASQVPGDSFRARCLLPPRRVRSVLLVDVSRPMLASSHLADWPLSSCRNEAESSSRTLRLARWPGPASAARIAPARFGFGYMTFDRLSRLTHCS